MKNKKFTIRSRLRSFNYAFNGIKILVREEHNARIHIFAAICAVIAGFILNISSLEWISVLFSIGFVLAFEAINSAIESIADFVSAEKHDAIKKIKDLSAAAVLLSAITALIIGFIVFLPKILDLCLNY